MDGLLVVWHLLGGFYSAPHLFNVGLRAGRGGWARITFGCPDRASVGRVPMSGATTGGQNSAVPAACRITTSQYQQHAAHLSRTGAEAGRCLQVFCAGGTVGSLGYGTLVPYKGDVGLACRTATLRYALLRRGVSLAGYYGRRRTNTRLLCQALPRKAARYHATLLRCATTPCHYAYLFPSSFAVSRAAPASKTPCIRWFIRWRRAVLDIHSAVLLVCRRTFR
jgi:hypothetical protein